MVRERKQCYVERKKEKKEKGKEKTAETHPDPKINQT